MTEHNRKPKIGNSARLLGVRIPPDPKPDITPDAKGNVHPPTTKVSQGMSTAPSPDLLPPFRKPAAFGGTVTSANFKLWLIEASDLGPDLEILQDSSTHIAVGPARTMTLAEFQPALAATQSK
jgi:hypothetical protein